MNYVHKMDCNVAMKTFENNHFDLGVIDIPYGINVGQMSYLKEKGTTVKQKNGNRLNPHKSKRYIPKEWDLQTPNQEYFNELKRVTKHQIIFGVEYVDWKGLGPGRIKWNKMVPDGVSFKGYELAYCSFIDYTYDLDLLWSGMCQAKSLSEPTTQQGNKKLNEKRIHPTQKPVLLYKKLLLFYKEQMGDDLFLPESLSVLDTHVGSGSSRIACFDMNVDFMGYEIDEDHFNDQEKRFKNHISQLSIFA